jgi:hypothetical protein
MAEWLKALAWKASIRQKRIVGSNPSLSANPKKDQQKQWFMKNRILWWSNTIDKTIIKL